MPFDGLARWEIEIAAADRTQKAFDSVGRRFKAVDQDLKRVTASLDRQQQTMAGFAAKQAEFASGFALVSRAAGPLAGVLSAAGLAARTWSAGMAAANLPDQAAQLGVTTDALQAYRATALTAGVEVGQLDGALQRLTAAMGQASGGSEEAIAKFDRLGVKLLDARGELRPLVDVLPEAARGLLAIGNEAERNALAQDLFGRSGARVVTMLEQLARGTDAVTEEARAQGLVLETDVIAAWSKLDNQIKTANATLDAMLATFAAPIVTAGLEHINAVLATTRKEIDAIVAGWKFITGTRAVGDELAAVNRDITAFQERGYTQDNPVMKDLVARRDALLTRQANEAPAMLLDPVTVAGGTVGTGQPAVKGKGGGAAKEAKGSLDELIASIEKFRSEGEGVMDRFGDGTAYAARETAKLNELFQLGFIDAGTHAIALQDVAMKADDMGRAYRGAQGGWDGFVAGLEQGMTDLARANTEFEMGKRLIDELSGAIGDLVSGAEVDFGRLAQSFASMLIQMEMQAAMSNIFNSITGNGKPTDAGIGGMIGGWLGDIFGGFFAEGGRPPVGLPSVVGEEGPELFVPDRAGTIVPNHALRGGAGGGQDVLYVMLDSELLDARIDSRSDRRIVVASPRIVSTAVDRSREEVVPTMHRYEAERGGDWRG